MLRVNRRTAGLLVVGALATTALVAPAVGQAKTVKISMKTQAGGPPPNGNKITGTYKGKPFGTCKMKGTLVIPKSLQTWKCKGGTLSVDSTGTTGAANDAKGSFKITKGTGKYKGIKGKGTWAGQISTGVFLYKGSAKY